MSDPVWYRSLYWRIAFGFIAMLAILLLAQGLLYLWLTDRLMGSPARTPAALAESGRDVAAESRHRISILRGRPLRHHQPFPWCCSTGSAVQRPARLPPTSIAAWSVPVGLLPVNRQPPRQRIRGIARSSSVARSASSRSDEPRRCPWPCGDRRR
jgi:hypothetical protein